MEIINELCILAENGILEELDFSWNQIRGPGAMAMVRGLKVNHIFFKKNYISSNHICILF